MIIERKEVKCMRKTGRSFKRAFSLVLAALFVCMTLAPCAFAADTTGYVAVENYSKPDSVISVTTSPEGKVGTLSTCPWKFENGVLQPGNHGKSNSISVLKITTTGEGVLSFKYMVSAPDETMEGNPDSLVYWKNNTDNITASFGNMIAKERVNGEQDWTTGTMSAVGETNDFYFMYKKNGTVNGREDCAWLKDIVFLSGTFDVVPSSNNNSLGTVSGGGTGINAGVETTVTAQANSGSTFFGWVVDGNLVSQDAVYKFLPIKDTTPLAVFGNANTAAQNLKTGNVYNSLADAMSEAKSGDTVMLLKNCTVSTAVTIPVGVKVYVPYSAEYDEDGNTDGTTADSVKLAADKAFRTLTVANGGSINVKGTLCVGGVIGYPSQPAYQGHTSGAYGKIVNNGSITVADSGVLDCWGFIDGSGTVTALNGAKVYEPFIVYDFVGGTNTSELYGAGQSPFTQYTMQNISCALDVSYGAELIGRCNLYAMSEFNKTDAVIVGDGGLTSLESGAVLHRTVKKSVTCGDYCSDLGKVTYSFDGGASFGYLSLLLLGKQPVTTEDVLFPIPYGFDYILNKGTYSVDTDIVVMPGASMTVGDDAVLCVNDRFVVLDGLKQNALAGKSYPSTDMLKNAEYPTNGVLTVNGTMKIADGMQFVGIVQTGNLNAKVITGSDCDFSEDVILGANTPHVANKTILPLKGQVMMNDVLTQLESGKTYYADSTDGWTLPGYSVDSGSGVETVTTNQAAKGSFSLAAPHTHVFDRQNTSAEYLKSGACCTSPAVYYYSCTCGEMGTATFTYGNNTDHDYGNGNKCVRCGADKPGIPGDSGDSGNSGGFFSRLLNTLKGIFSKLFGWLPFC